MPTKAIALFLAAALCVPAHAQLGKILQGIGKKDSGDSTTASGLKEALQIGTENAVNLTGTTDGYFKNQAIKILLPEKLQAAEKGMRLVGMGPKIDDFVMGMNRAAEKAAPAARAILKDAVLKMTFDDARGILTGGDTSATEFFKSKTSESLTTAFKPTVASAMEEVGVARQYNQLAGGIASLPFGGKQSFDITDYVVGRALNGLFVMLGEEEKKIRTNPAAQITPLLKQVFGKR